MNQKEGYAEIRYSDIMRDGIIDLQSEFAYNGSRQEIAA